MSVSFGSLSSVGGKSVLTGSATGIDTEGLIKALTEAKRLPATKKEDEIKVNNKQIEALSELKTILSKLKDSANSLRNPPGVGTASQNIFQKRTSFLSSSSAVAATTYMGASASAGAALGKHTITITNPATSESRKSVNAFTDRTSSITDAAGTNNANKFSAGTFQVNGANVTINEGYSLNDIVSAFNAVTGTSNVTASVLQVASNDFRLVLTNNTTGAANGITITDPDSVVSPTITFNSISTAANASLVVDGETVSRSTNTISDVIEGVTLNLYQGTPMGTTLTLDVDKDSQSIATGISDFVNAYNDFRVFTAKQQERDEKGLLKDTAVLNQSTSMRSAIDSAASELNRVVNGITGGNPNKLSDIGITFDDALEDTEKKIPATKNIMVLDAAKLTTALESNFNGVRKVFEMAFAASTSQIGIYNRTNALSATSFTVDVNTARSAGDEVRITSIDGATQDPAVNMDYSYDGYNALFSGKAGTALEGLSMLYSGGATSSFTVNVTQGIGDRLYNVLDSLLASDTGSIDAEIQGLEDSNTKLETDVALIDEQVTSYREDLLQKFSALEAAVASSNRLIDLLTAQTNVQNSNN